MSDTAAAGPYGIIGLGLVGGSLALALKRLQPEARIVGCEPQAATRRAALEAGAVDHAGATADAHLRDCRLVFIATPLGELHTLLPQLRDHLAPGAVLTDVIGVKGPVALAVAQYLPGTTFIGGHPMAGGERGGFAAARADLFDGSPVALCPESNADAGDLSALWRALGATPIVMSADAHDRQVAVTSHLPYLAAVALTAAVEALGPPPRLAGRGLQDATRHAAFAPNVMASVCAANPHLPAAARDLARDLLELADLAEADPAGLSQRASASRPSTRAD